MPRSKDKIIADLVVMQVDHDEEMSYSELWDLVEKAKAKEKEAKAKEKAEAEAEAKAKAEAKDKAAKPLDLNVSSVPCGIGTTQDQERRIRIIEHKLGI